MKKMFTIIIGLLIFYFSSQANPWENESSILPVEILDLDLKDSVPQVPVDDRVLIGKLENGIKYYIQPNQKPEDRAELRLVVHAGSIDEDDDQRGLAHFVEHMAFNGSENFEKNELVEYLQSTGARFGPDLNAYTSFDETVYMLQVRTDTVEIFDKGLLILKDWAQGVSFDPEEVDKERGVVISELRSGLSADQRMLNEYLPVIFKDSKYAERLPIGTREILSNASVETIKRFYNDWYRPELMALVIVGDFELESTLEKVKSMFSDIQNPEKIRAKEDHSFPTHQETLVSICKDEEASYTTGQIYYKKKRKERNGLPSYRSGMINNLYNRMLNQRLNELRQQSDPPFIYAYSGYSNQVGDLDAYVVYVNAPEGGILKSLEAALIENKRVLDHGFTESELERQKVEIISQLKTVAEEEDKTPSNQLAGRYVNNYLDETPIPSPTQRLDLAKELLPAIQLSEINHLAKEWIVDSNRVIVITGPDKEEIPLPQDNDVLQLIEQVQESSVEPYEDGTDDRPLISEVAAPGKIINRKEINEVGVTELELSNGIKVVLKPTDFQNDEINFTAFSPGGHSLYPDSLFFSASLASVITTQAGVGDFNLIELQKKLTGKQVNVSPYISEREEGMQGFSTITDLETMFQLIYLYGTKPRKDEEAFNSFITRQKQILQNILVNPNYYFSEEATKIKFNDHPRRGIPSMEDLEKVKLDKCYQVYQERFADFSDFTFIFIGNFTPESIEPLITKYLAALPSTKREEGAKDVDADYVAGKVEESFKFGKAPKAQVDITFHGDFEWDIRENRAVFNAMSDVLKDKLRIAMREDKGGVYGVRVYDNLEKFPEEEYSINISFNAEPEEVEDLVNTCNQEIVKMKTEGATPEELQKVFETNKQSRIKGLKENGFWGNALKSYYVYDLDLENLLLENYIPVIEKITSEDIKEMANKSFDFNQMIKIVMMPGENN